MQGMAPTSAPSHIAQAAAAIATCQDRDPEVCWPHIPVNKTTVPVLWRPLAYLQKASSAPRSPPRVQRAPRSHLPGVGLARCLFGNL